MFSSSTGFSLWGSVLARTKPTQAEACATQPHDSGFFLAPSWILVPSPQHDATSCGPGLSGDIDSSAFAQFVGAADALASGVYPSGKRTPLDRHLHSGYALSSRQGQVAPKSRAAGSFRLPRLPDWPAGGGAGGFAEPGGRI